MCVKRLDSFLLETILLNASIIIALNGWQLCQRHYRISITPKMRKKISRPVCVCKERECRNFFPSFQFVSGILLVICYATNVNNNAWSNLTSGLVTRNHLMLPFSDSHFDSFRFVSNLVRGFCSKFFSSVAESL